MKRINTKKELEQLTVILGMRPDWHEPGEQRVSAKVRGWSFDNAGFWPSDPGKSTHITEMHVILFHENEPVAAVNLATLFAWATGLEEGPGSPGYEGGS